MKDKKTKIIIFSVIIALLLAGVIYYIFTKQDKRSTLTIFEKQWIDKNKNSLIDVSIVNNVPIFNYDGTGLLLDFIEDLEKDTGLAFNKLSYQSGTEANNEYTFKFTKEHSDNEILIYEDSYVLVTKKKVKYLKAEDIDLTTIGVYKDQFEDASKYLGNSNAAFKSYEDYATMFSDVSGELIDGIVIPRVLYLKDVVGNSQLNISYNITEMHDNLVLSLGENEKLNVIFIKYYNKWKTNGFKESFNENFTSNYFKFLSIEDTDKAKFRSKRYTYGFIPNMPFDFIQKGKLAGINNEVLKSFSALSETEITYKEYKNVESLLKAFNSNEIDFMFGINPDVEYALDVYETIPVADSKTVLISKYENNQVINSLFSIDGKVGAVKGTKIFKYLTDNKIEVKGYNNVKDLIKNKNKVTYLALDLESYEYYVHNSLINYKLDYSFDINDDYGYIIRNITDNNAFAKFFDYYLSYDNITVHQNLTIKNLLDSKNNQNVIYSVLGFIIVVLTAVLAMLLKKRFSNKKTIVINKNDKIKYIDILTSLKNRTYLNDSIEKWDNSEVYPQTIIIVDLNNVAYINDNYGHEEGDNLIKEAANILIKNQIDSSEIMRTNGNEFLIYMVGYDEKQVVSYTRKLNKEFKELAHGFGAAIGYSMITDAIKTIDDAVNEATLDMRNNKEEINN